MDAIFVLELDASNLIKGHAVPKANQTYGFATHVIKEIGDGGLSAGDQNTVGRDLFVEVGFAGASWPQLAEVEVVLHKRQHTDDEQPLLAVRKHIRLHAYGAQQHIHPLVLRERLPALFQFRDVYMGHLNGRELADADRRSVPVFFHVLVIQLHNAPDTAAEQPVKLGRILFINGDVFQAEIGKLGLVVVPLDVQVDRDLVNHGVTATLPEYGEDLLRLIRSDEVVRQNALDIVYPVLNDFRVIRAAILSQKELQHIDRDICALFDFLGQVLADDFSIELLPQLFFDNRPFIFGLHKISH